MSIAAVGAWYLLALKLLFHELRSSVQSTAHLLSLFLLQYCLVKCLGIFRAREMSVAESRFQLINNDSLIHYFISYQPHLSLLINLWEFGKISKVSWWWRMNHVFKRAQSFFYISCKCLAKASYTIKNRCFSFFIYLDTDFHRLNTRPLFLYVNYIPHSKCPFKMILLLF